MENNYIRLVSTYFPGVEVYTKSDPAVYENLVFTKGTASKADLDAYHLVEHKTEKITELGVACRTEITGGFKSSALGQEYWYDSELEDQLNLIGATQLGMDIMYKCGTLPEIEKSYQLHTNAQLQQVFADAVSAKSTVLQKFATLKAQVQACTTKEEVDAITW